LCLDRSRHSLFCIAKDHRDSIAARSEHSATVMADGLSDQVVLIGNELGGELRRLVPESGRPFHIGK
jgi:hypothetical protein